MLSGRRKSDGQTVLAYFERKSNGPFACVDCGEEMVLKSGRNRVDYFAHRNPLARHNADNESEAHRACKREIYEALLRAPAVSDVGLEESLGAIRPDLLARIHGTPVAIEIQISSLSIDAIINRTIWYARKGIYVLWLLPWNEKLRSERYSPQIWERWIHAAYFGRVYYWTHDLNVVSYHFAPSLNSIPKVSFYSRTGERVSAGGFTRRSKRFRQPVRGKLLHLVHDFGPCERLWWEGGGLKVPDAKLYAASSKSERYSDRTFN